jgi:Cdc6-like AAA superfamily ATPase
MEAVANDGSYFELGHDRAELMISDAFNLNAAHFIKGAVFVACLPAVTPEEKARFLEACQRRAPDEYFIRYAYLHEVGTRILLTRIPEDAMHPFRQYSVHLDNPLNKFIWDGLQERWSKLFPQGESDAGPEEESILAADLAVSADQSREETDRRLAKVALERLMRNKAAAAASAASSSSNSSVNLSVKSTMPAAERYSLAKHQLQLSTLPPKLQCRGEERKKVLEFLVSKLENTGEGGVMYIAGLPGTGKTATVLECVRTLQTAHELGECPPFQFVNVNGMALADPQQLYRIMYNALTGKAVVPAHAADMLEKLFSAQTAKRVCCVMLVDELDQIVAKGTRVVYNLVEWAIRPFSQLVVIGIANTMDLPERLLPRIASRFGTWRIQFAPYSQPQLVQILASRIEDAHVFEPSSIEFVSQKVAQLGDCRRALHLCSLAVDAAAREWRLSGKVSSSPVLVHVKHIDEALVQMALSARVTRTAVRDLPKLARRVMCQIANLSIVQTANLSNRSADSSLIRIDSVCDRVLSVYAAEKDRPSRADILRILHSPLAAMNLVQLVDVGPTTDEDTTASIKFRSAYASKSGLTVPLCVRLVSDVNDLQRWFADDPDPGCAIKDNMDGVRNW